jgi:hypothetical protein
MEEMRTVLEPIVINTVLGPMLGKLVSTFKKEGDSYTWELIIHELGRPEQELLVRADVNPGMLGNLDIGLLGECMANVACLRNFQLPRIDNEKSKLALFQCSAVCDYLPGPAWVIITPFSDESHCKFEVFVFDENAKAFRDTCMYITDIEIVKFGNELFKQAIQIGKDYHEGLP